MDRVHISIYQLLTICGCLFLIGSAEVIAGPMMYVMGRHFGASSSAIAYLSAAYGLTYGSVALVAGPLSDHFGRKWPLVAGLIGFGACNAAIPQSPVLSVAISLSALCGLCAAIIQPNALSLIGDIAGGEEAGRRVGQAFVGLMAAFVVTPLGAGWAAKNGDWESAYYLLSALASGAVFFVALLFDPDRRTSAERLPFLALVSGALRVQQARLSLSISYLWLGWMAGFGAVVAGVAARKLDLRSTDVALVVAYWGAAIIVGNLSGHRLNRCLHHVALPFGAGIAALGVLAFALPVSSLVALGAVGTPWALGYGCAGPLHHARLNGLSVRFRGTINSLHASLLNFGIFSVSLLFGATAPTAPMSLFCGAVALVGFLGALLSLAVPGSRFSAPRAE